MEQNTIILIVGLAGIGATLISSGLGLYFTSHARSAPIREYLYSKQIELVSQIISTIGRIKVFLPIIIDNKSPFKEQAQDDLREKIKILSELGDKAAALLPTELFVEVSQITRLLIDLIENFEKGNDINKFLSDFNAYAAKTAMLSRVCLGIDELSTESISLFTNKNRINKLSKLKPEDIMKI